MEEMIRKAYPAAAYIEFEPDSKDKTLKVQGERILTEEGREKERTHLREALVVVTHLMQQQRAATAGEGADGGGGGGDVSGGSGGGSGGISGGGESSSKRTSTTPPWVVLEDKTKMKRIQAQMQREMRERAARAVGESDQLSSSHRIPLCPSLPSLIANANDQPQTTNHKPLKRTTRTG